MQAVQSWRWAGLVLLGVLVGCATPLTPQAPAPSGKPALAEPMAPAAPRPLPAERGAGPVEPLLTGATQEIEQGAASWYGRRFHGRRTASGEVFDVNALTAAHRTLPFGTLVRVRSLVTGREVDVRINDRGPHVAGRIIDLSQAAAEALGLVGLGIKPVVLLVSAGDAGANPGSAQTFGQARPSGRSKAATRKRRASVK